MDGTGARDRCHVKRGEQTEIQGKTRTDTGLGHSSREENPEIQKETYRIATSKHTRQLYTHRILLSYPPCNSRSVWSTYSN